MLNHRARRRGFASIEQAAFARLRRTKGDCSIHLAHRLANAKISPHNLSRRGGRAVDRAGLEIRIQDFALNWTGFAHSVPVFDEFTFLIRVNWTGVVARALNFFERVTFAGY